MVQSSMQQSSSGLETKAEALFEASYLAGFSMVGDAGDETSDAPQTDEFSAIAAAPRRAKNPWHVGRPPVRKRWAQEALEAFARRLDEVSARPKPLTRTALVVWQPAPKQSWLTQVASVARSVTPRLHLPFTRHTSA